MKQKINSWADITVGQFMDLHQLSKQKNTDALEQAEQAICIMYNLTHRQVEDLPIQEFNKLAKECTAIMTSEISGSVQKYIHGRKCKYKITYDPKKLMHRQFVEIQHFMEDMFNNIHNIMASIVEPVGKFGIAKKNSALMHAEISDDLTDAKIVDVYHSCVFFCKLYLNSLVHIQGYLVHEMMSKGATKEQATTLIEASINAMAGSITQKNWLLLKV